MERSYAIISDFVENVHGYRFQQRPKPTHMLCNQPDGSTILHHARHTSVEVPMIEIPIRLPQDEFGPSISRERTKRSPQIHRRIRLSKSIDSLAQPLQVPRDDIQPTRNSSLGEERAHRRSTPPMQVVLYGADTGVLL